MNPAMVYDEEKEGFALLTCISAVCSVPILSGSPPAIQRVPTNGLLKLYGILESIIGVPPSLKAIFPALDANGDTDLILFIPTVKLAEVDVGIPGEETLAKFRAFPAWV